MFDRIAAIFIDLDGTLVDSVPDLTVAVDRVMAELGLSPRGETNVRQWVGNGVEKLLHRAISNDIHGQAPADLMIRARSLFDTAYRDNLCVHSCLYPGVKEGLDALSGRQLRLACITNKPTGFARTLLFELGIGDKFAVIVGGDAVANHKPAPDGLHLCAQQLGVNIEHSLMVGDSVNDVAAARNAGCPVVCVPYGYNHGRDIREAKPDAVIDTLADLGGLLQKAA